MEFPEREKRRQKSYQKRHCPEGVNGCRSRPTPGGLLPGQEASAFYPPAAEAILAYGREHRLPIHVEARNLRSSLAACLNVLFPLRNHLELAALALEPTLPGLGRVHRLEFLYPNGEVSALRPDMEEDWPQASPGCQCDAAIWWEDDRGRQRLSLCCWSYTEASYGTCGGFRTKSNDNQRACLYLPAAATDRSAVCYLSRQESHWLRWEQLVEAGIRLAAAEDLVGCPFRGPFYQFLRYSMLAAVLRRTEQDTRVDAIFVSFRENDQINRTPRHLALLGDDIVRAWNRLLSGVPPLRSVHAEAIVAGLRRDRSGVAAPHLHYLAERYGFC